MDLKEARDFILHKTRENALCFGDRLPEFTQKGKYNFVDQGTWVGGFWTGLNYLCHEMSGDHTFLEAARKSRHRFIKRLYENKKSLDHDIGFLFTLSCVADYKITGDLEARKIALDAADMLANRFNEKGGFIQAWDVWEPGNPFCEENRGRVIIDCMYNLPLLFWASEETGNKKYMEIATTHAETCANTIIRADYTTFHTYVFDPETGKPMYGRTCQGYSNESCWARGQGWAIGGYAYAYRYTKNIKFLEVSKNCTQVFLNNLEEDQVPMWDFSLKNRNDEPRDASAGAIAAAGILELSNHVSASEREFYRGEAIKIIESLYNNYATKALDEEEGLLMHACVHKPANRGVDCSNIYGDYYFAEAIGKIMGNTKIYW